MQISAECIRLQSVMSDYDFQDSDTETDFEKPVKES